MSIHKFKLYGVIASDVEAMYFGDEGLITLKQVNDELEKAGGSDIEVDMSSIGGLVSVGVDIYFAFRDYKRANPQAQMQLNMKSQIASMASHIASGEFWDLVTAEDISSWMIHNPAMGVYGDYRIAKQASEHLERLANLYMGSYKKRSGRKEDEIKKMMDDTTYLFGEEIVKYGFADAILPTAEEKDRSSMIAMMESKYKSVMQKIKQVESSKDDLQIAVARMQSEKIVIPETTTTEPTTQPQQEPATSGKNNQEEKLMDINELKMNHPDIFAEAQKAGIDQEKERVKALVEMKKKKDFEGVTPILERIDEAIEKGESVNDVQMAIVAMSMKSGTVSAALDSNGIGELGNGELGSVSGEGVQMSAADKEKKNEEW